MKNSYFALFFLAIITSVAILFSACKKLNEATELGAGLIPPVDNITTFDTSLSVQAFNDTFGLANDSQYLARNEEFFLGKINSDPFFGRTDARLFLELKPPFFKYFFNNKPDSLYIDSVVLVLDYLETYGDTNTAQTVNVYELDQSNNFRSDTSYLIRKSELTYSNLLGSKTFLPKNLDDSVKAYRDSTKNQLRVRLNNSFGTRLLGYDSTGVSGAYSSDSVFRTYFKGFAVQSMNTGNAVMGFDLTGFNTKLAIYYRYNKGGPAKFDTTVTYFSFSPNCAAANYVKRDYINPMLSTVGDATQDQVVYIQGSPGTFATIKIPDLGVINNRLIHRAELIVEQLYDISDSTFRVPEILYLDAFDSTITSNKKFRAIPYDLSFNNFGQPDFLNPPRFGVLPITSTDGSGNKIRTWKFNISRYVQHVLTRTQTAYALRLYAPFTVSNKFILPASSNDPSSIFNLNPTIVKGRIRLGGGNHPTQRMRLRLIYSKL